MSTLHTVNKSPFDRNSLASCLDHLLPGDAVLLVEDGVVGARKGASSAGRLAAATKECAVYVLAPDLAARGMKEEHLIEGAKLVDYDGFVDLVAANDRTQAWL